MTKPEPRPFDVFLVRHNVTCECWSGVGEGWWPILEALFVELRAAAPRR